MTGDDSLGIGLNGGPAFRHNEALSFQIATDDQDEIDRYWNAIVGKGGQESACGWCKDKWGAIRRSRRRFQHRLRRLHWAARERLT